MEFVFEILLELLLEGTFEVSKNKRVSKYIRYPLILLIMLFFAGVIFLFFFTGVLAYQKMDRLFGVILVIIGIVFLVCSVIKFKKVYIEKKNK